MESAKYSDLKIHTQIHNDFLAKLKTLKAPLDAASITWVKEWYVRLYFLIFFLLFLSSPPPIQFHPSPSSSSSSPGFGLSSLRSANRNFILHSSRYSVYLVLLPRVSCLVHVISFLFYRTLTVTTQMKKQTNST